jgi:hypothetical protein
VADEQVCIFYAALALEGGAVWAQVLFSPHFQIDANRIGQRYGAFTLIILYLYFFHCRGYADGTGEKGLLLSLGDFRRLLRVYRWAVLLPYVLPSYLLEVSNELMTSTYKFSSVCCILTV